MDDVVTSYEQYKDIASVVWLVTWESLWGEDFPEMTDEHVAVMREFTETLATEFALAYPNAEISVYHDAAQYAGWHSRVDADLDVPWKMLNDAFEQALMIEDNIIGSEWWGQVLERLGNHEEVAA